MLSWPMRYLSLVFFSTVLLLALVQTAEACSCGPKPTVLDAVDHSDEVVIARAVSVEKVQSTEERRHVNDVRSTRMIVEKVFKGKLNVGDEIVLGQGGGADCIGTFSEYSVGKQFLFYLDRPENNSSFLNRLRGETELWITFICGRSSDLVDAREDLQYLENISKLRGRTRISGRLFGPGATSKFPVDGKKIKLIGSQKTYEVKTDEDGVFEIYDLPAGRYSVEPETPTGWKLEPYWFKYSSSVVRNDFDRPEMKTPTQVSIMLEPKKHASIEFLFGIQNSVSGRIVDHKGKPLVHVCVNLLAPGKSWGPSDCTNEQGQFEITSISEGQFVLVANLDGKFSPNEPFQTTYYPGVAEREFATVINLGPGDTLNNFNLIITPVAERVVLEGLLLHSDGKPAIDTRVRFRVTEANDKVQKSVVAYTDRLGRFSLTVLKGLNGEIAGEQWLLKDYYVNCPKVDELLAKSGGNNVTVFSNVVKLKTDQNVYNVELTLPFPACRKAK